MCYARSVARLIDGRKRPTTGTAHLGLSSSQHTYRRSVRCLHRRGSAWPSHTCTTPLPLPSVRQLSRIAVAYTVSCVMDGDESIAAATSECSSHRPSIPRLPVEVCERIIDHIAMGWHIQYTSAPSDPHLFTLTSCALVCQDWYFLTWYYLRQRIHLRDRKDVLSLSRTLRAKPRLREVVQQVVISGASPGKRQAIPHLGTFAAMLAGKTPMLSTFIIEDAEWTIGLVRTEDIDYLAAFSSIDTLILRHVTLSSVTQLSRLVSALPGLVTLCCFSVDCLQKQQVSPASLPLNCANLEDLEVVWVAPAVEDLFVQISRASRVRNLRIGVGGELDPSSAVSRSQTLLDASSTSAERVVLHIDPESPVRDGTIEAVVGKSSQLSLQSIG
ncbi:uncharacterized protein B0H18DRAFT_939180 [Fomitopsis serialis]|uniref:uncharacterized protein n=1 Tax=Fomitopsis serialis TaxID=139415 RepID=UPI002008AB11|nr:uncharacterized protein B0H18DRAFT_939180 [Neoantrodia serialis]KAH9916511.1 hypothetical protein B0H18DRAFT_939180 [Neoantrodia serialis]